MLWVVQVRSYDAVGGTGESYDAVGCTDEGL